MTAASPDPKKSTPISVLLVDDNVQLLESSVRALGRRGFAVTPCSSGAEALQALQDVGADVIVSDVSMPGMTGVELLQRVRERDMDIPVVLMTGAPTVDTAAKAVDHGAFKYLVKPVETKLLAETIERAAGLYRLARMERLAMSLIGRNGGLGLDPEGLQASLDRAMDGLWLACQPIIDTSGAVVAYEALMRSDEPALPHPGAMLDAAERLDQVVTLGRVVRQRAAGLLNEAPPDVLLFVNLHPAELCDPRLGSDGDPLTSEAARVVLEVTERELLHDVADARAQIARLRELGFRIAVDDLGAGYAGLSTFAQLEPEYVKLDMSLIRDVDTSATRQKVIRSMTALCKDMGMMVVAEGIETAAERDAVLELGCDLLQGYLFARPGPPFPPADW